MNYCVALISYWQDKQSFKVRFETHSLWSRFGKQTAGKRRAARYVRSWMRIAGGPMHSKRVATSSIIIPFLPPWVLELQLGTAMANIEGYEWKTESRQILVSIPVPNFARTRVVSGTVLHYSFQPTCGYELPVSRCPLPLYFCCLLQHNTFTLHLLRLEDYLEYLLLMHTVLFPFSRLQLMSYAFSLGISKGKVRYLIGINRCVVMEVVLIGSLILINKGVQYVYAYYYNTECFRSSRFVCSK